MVEKYAVEGIVGEEEGAVEVDKIGQRSEVGGSRDADGTLDHAPDHHLHVQRPGDRDHVPCFPQAAGFGELDVDAVGGAGEDDDVVAVADALIGDEGWYMQGEEAAEEVPVVGAVGGDGLLDEAEVIGGEARDDLDGLLVRPRAVGVHAEVCLGRLPRRSNEGFVLRDVARADFELDDRGIPEFPEAHPERVGIGLNIDRAATQWGVVGVEAPCGIERAPEGPGPHIVEGDVEGRTGGEGAGGQSRERTIKTRRHAVEERVGVDTQKVIETGFQRESIVGREGAFAEAITQRHHHILPLLRGAVRDTKRRSEAQRKRLGGQFHLPGAGVNWSGCAWGRGCGRPGG